MKEPTVPPKTPSYNLRYACPFWTHEQKLLQWGTLQNYYGTQIQCLFVERASAICRNHQFHGVAVFAPGFRPLTVNHRFHRGHSFEPSYGCFVFKDWILSRLVNDLSCYHIAEGYALTDDYFVLIHRRDESCPCRGVVSRKMEVMRRHYAYYPGITDDNPLKAWAQVPERVEVLLPLSEKATR